MFAKLLCTLDSLPVLDSLEIVLPNCDLNSEQQFGMRRIAQLSSLLCSLRLCLNYHNLQLLQGYSALSCLTCLQLELHGDIDDEDDGDDENDDALLEQDTIVLPSFVLQLHRLQSLALSIYDSDAGYSLPKVGSVARLLVLLL